MAEVGLELPSPGLGAGTPGIVWRSLSLEPMLCQQSHKDGLLVPELHAIVHKACVQAYVRLSREGVVALIRLSERPTASEGRSAGPDAPVYTDCSSVSVPAAPSWRRPALSCLSFWPF